MRKFTLSLQQRFGKRTDKETSINYNAKWQVYLDIRNDKYEENVYFKTRKFCF